MSCLPPTSLDFTASFSHAQRQRGSEARLVAMMSPPRETICRTMSKKAQRSVTRTAPVASRKPPPRTPSAALPLSPIPSAPSHTTAAASENCSSPSPTPADSTPPSAGMETHRTTPSPPSPPPSPAEQSSGNTATPTAHSGNRHLDARSPARQSHRPHPPVRVQDLLRSRRAGQFPHPHRAGRFQRGGERAPLCA